MIDIIIPAYNAHETIGTTIESIAKQKEKDLVKVYIIDDGSEQGYEYLLDEYKDKLDIVLLREENAGPGAARQLGIDNSNNEFLMFVDADDRLYDEYVVTTLLNHSKDADLVQSYTNTNTGDEMRLDPPQYCYLHGKLFRRSIIVDNNIKFDTTKRVEGDIYEDSTYNMIYRLYCNNIVTVEDPTYVYEYNPKSITKTEYKDNKHMYNFIGAMEWFFKEVRKRKIKDKDKEIAWDMYITVFFLYFNYNTDPTKYEFEFKRMKMLKEEYLKYKDLLPEDEKIKMFFEYQNKTVIPIITFYDFMDKIE